MPLCCRGYLRTALYLMFLALGAAAPFRLAVADPILIDASQRVGAVPGYAGTGLDGLYYDNNFGYSTDAGAAPQASFTTTNICYPDCFQGRIRDGDGGLSYFTNGNASNIVDLTGSGLRGSWDSSQLILSGYIAITQPGTYTFSLGSDDNSFLTIAGQSIASIPGCCYTDVEQATFSAAGLYAIAVNFQEGGGSSYLSLTAFDPTFDPTSYDPYSQDASPTGCILGCTDANGNLQANTLFYSQAQIDSAPAPVTGAGWLSLLVAMGVIGLRKVRWQS